MTDLLDGFDAVANCTSVCQDGIILSHKVVIASVSNILKSIISEIPDGDEVSVYFPGVKAQDIKNKLHNSLLEKTYNFDDYIGTETEQDLTSNLITESKIKLEEYWEEMGAAEETEDNTVIKFTNARKLKHNPIKDYRKESLLGNIEEDISILRARLSESTLSEKKRWAFGRRLKLNLALHDLRSGKIGSLLGAAKFHKVKHSTLREFVHGIRTGSGMGPGRYSTIFGEEEEKTLVQNILEKSNNGRELTRDIIRDIITEKLKLKRLTYPDVTLPLKDFGDKGVWVNRTWASRFTRRHGLDKYLNKTDGNCEGFQDNPQEDNNLAGKGQDEAQIPIKFSKKVQKKTEIRDLIDDSLLLEVQQEISNLQSKLMDDTISDKKRKCFEKCLQMSIALQDLRCGKFDSIYKTAKVHNLKYSTFRDFIVGKTKEFGMGSGRKSIVFEPEEEERIVGLILNESNFGLTLTRKIIRDILTDELKLKKLLNPDLSLPLKDLGAKGQ